MLIPPAEMKRRKLERTAHNPERPKISYKYEQIPGDKLHLLSMIIGDNTVTELTMSDDDIKRAYKLDAELKQAIATYRANKPRT